MENKKEGHIYLLWEREFISLNQYICKIGTTTRGASKRVSEYPKDSRVILVTEVNDCYGAERNIIQRFKQLFKHKKDIGREYFEGNISDMKYEMNHIVLKYEMKYDDTPDKSHYLTYLNERTKGSSKHMHSIDLYNDFIIWFNKKNFKDYLPNNREFVDNIKKHKTFSNGVKFNGKVSTGFKNICLID